MTGRAAFPLVISGPSGAGKSSVAEWLLETDRDIVHSVSCTTRAKRGQEVEGIDYFFVAEQDFLARRDRGEFVEWALVHGNLYGTPASFLDQRIAEGKTVLLDIDVQGGMQIRESRPDAVLVFLMPPDLRVLEERLRGRHTDSEEVIERRLKAARREMGKAAAYDYLVVNHDLTSTREAVRAIVAAERCRTARVLTGELDTEALWPEAGIAGSAGREERT
jgi:guanylate kinase